MSFIAVGGTLLAGGTVTAGTVAAGAGLATAGLTAYNMSQAGGGSSAPPARNLGNETTQTLQAQLALSPQVLQAYQQYAPQYAQTDLGIYGRQLFGPDWQGQSLTDINQALTNQAIQQTLTGNSALRQQNMQDVNVYGGQALQAIYNLNTPLYQNMDQLDAMARAGLQPNAQQQQLANLFQQGPQFQSVNPQSVTYQNVGTNPISAMMIGGPQQARDVAAQQVRAQTGYTPVQAQTNDLGLTTAAQRLGNVNAGPLQSTLEGQAMNDLLLGRSLSDQQVRDAQQEARSAYAARGLGDSNAAVAAEVLNLDQAATQREQQRRAFAAQTEQQGFGERQQGLQSALGLSQAAQGYAGLGLQAQQSNLGAQMQGNQLTLQGDIANQNSGLQAALANQQTDLAMNQQRYQAALANQQAALAASQSNQSDAARAALANQQYGYNTSLANSQLGIQAGLANQQAGLQAQAQNNTLGLNLANMGNQQQQQGYSNLLAASQQRAATAFDPFRTILNQTTANQGTNSGLYAMAGPTTATGQNVQNFFNPFNSYSSDLFNTNYNAQAASNIANANSRSALAGAGLGALGTLGGAYLGGLGCYVAREVYGEDNPRWLDFRDWMLNRSPEWFRELYLTHAEAFAEFIKDKPDMKDIIRAAMENILWQDSLDRKEVV